MYPIVYMIIDTYYKGVIGLSISNLSVSPSVEFEGLLETPRIGEINDEERFFVYSYGNIGRK